MVSQYIVGTSGYSFEDWVGEFYPPGTKRTEMFPFYAREFSAVELNYTYYRMPAARTMDSLAAKSPDGFRFWVKANQRTTHAQDRTAAAEFLDNLAPMQTRGRLAGVLLQFPQSFHRTMENRKYLRATADDFASVSLAVEFRHASWDTPATLEGLRERGLTLVIPDVPALEGLFRPAPAATAPVAYLRLHSRNADNWYAGAAERYDYSYTDRELREIEAGWRKIADASECVCVFFNNCHHGQAVKNAKRFMEIIRGA
jgi:uncharacterized protein YecE (DUF72 family)